MFWYYRFKAWLRWNWEWYARRQALSRGADRIKVGDRYEDCAYKVRTATDISYAQDILWGVDDDGNVGSCSPTMCGVEKVV
jgi:hypothetical protein